MSEYIEEESPFGSRQKLLSLVPDLEALMANLSTLPARRKFVACNHPRIEALKFEENRFWRHYRRPSLPIKLGCRGRRVSRKPISN